MSDFLSRVAARAVGQAASAQPRLPALFEPSGAGIEIVQTEVAVPPSAPAPRARERQAVADATAAVTPAARVVPARREPAEPGPPRREPVELQRAAPAEHDPTRVLETVGERETVAPSPSEPHEPAPVAPARAARAASVPVTAAMPVAAPARAPQAAPAAREDAPTVRVHIGRLEVRANLQESPQPRPGRERPRPQELSLGDYLRGKKATG